MKTFFDWYYKFYPLENAPLKRKITVHLLFWILFGFFRFFSILPNSPYLFRITGGMYSIVESALLYYGLVYLVYPVSFSHKKTIIAIVLLFLLLYADYIITFMYFKFNIHNNLYIKESYMYKNVMSYMDRGLLGFFKKRNVIWELMSNLQALYFPLILKFTRIFGQYTANLQKVSAQKTDLELYFLRSQLNPHFLLNSLNNIYSQVINKNDSASNSTILLTNLLQHIINKSNDKLVNLIEELKFIADYIDLEKKKSSKNLKIKYTQEGDLEGLVIAPLILFNYIENAFKHSDAKTLQPINISIHISTIENKLFFKVENDYNHEKQKTTTTKNIGLGMINTQKRLKMLYPNNYVLKISTSKEKFTVEIEINLAFINSIKHPSQLK